MCACMHWSMVFKIVCFHCCFAGLTAVRSDEVYDLMMKDYPEKYHVRHPNSQCSTLIPCTQ